MTSDTLKHHDAHAEGHEHHDAGAITVFGFWVYIMSDLVLFATLFAVFAVLGTSYAGGPTGAELFDLYFVLAETFVLLISSFAIGLAMLAVHRGDKAKTQQWLLLTVILGALFVSLELYEFHHLVEIGASWQTSAFLSAYFTLVGTHGLHVTSGVIWGVVLLIQIGRKGLVATNVTRISCLSLFWHFLHIIWICVFSIVYLMGVM